MSCLTETFDSNCRCSNTEDDPYKYYSKDGFTCCVSTGKKILSSNGPSDALDYLQQSVQHTACDGFYNYKHKISPDTDNCLSTTANSHKITVKITGVITAGEFGTRQFLSEPNSIEYVTFSGVESIAGISKSELNSTYKVTFIDDNTFNIYTSTLAKSTVANGGGKSIVAVFENTNYNLIRLKAQTVLEYTLLSNFSAPLIERSGSDVTMSCEHLQLNAIESDRGNFDTVFMGVTMDSPNIPVRGDSMQGTLNGEKLFPDGNTVTHVQHHVLGNSTGIVVSSSQQNKKTFYKGQAIYFNKNLPNNAAYILQFPGYSENVTLPVCLDSTTWDPKDKEATLPKSFYYPTTLTYPVSIKLDDIKTSDCSVSNGVIDFTLYGGADKITANYGEYIGMWGFPDWVSRLGEPVYKSKGDIGGKAVKNWNWVVYMILLVVLILVMGGLYYIEHNKSRIRQFNMNKMKKGSGDRAVKRIMEN